MTAPNTTPGPWVVSQDANWPWGITIHGPDWDIRRVAYSTQAETIDDMRGAVGFSHQHRAEIVERIARQEADVRLGAAAPDLYEALEELLAKRSECFIPDDGGYWEAKCRAALAKARGEAA